MPTSKPGFLFASANPASELEDLGRSLDTELDQLEELLGATSPKGEEFLRFHKQPRTNRDKVLKYLDKPLLRKSIYYFHFAGHGLDGNLYFQNSEGDAEVGLMDGLVRVLNEFENLKLIYLNCCTSEKLALRLIDNKERIVIASPFKIPSETATQMASYFYGSLISGNSIGRSFSLAKSKMAAIDLNLNAIKRAAFDLDGEEGENKSPRGIDDLFQIYYGDNDLGLEDRLSDLAELMSLEETGGQAQKEPAATSQLKLYEPLLSLNYNAQMADYFEIRHSNEPKNIWAFLVRGMNNYGHSLLLHRYIRNISTNETLRMDLSLKDRDSTNDLATIWDKLGQAVGLGKGRLRSEIAEGVANQAIEYGRDLVISIRDASFYGQHELEKIFQDFWFGLLDELYMDISDIKSRIWLFVGVEDDAYQNKCEGLLEMNSGFKEKVTSITPLDKLIAADLTEMFRMHKQALVKQRHTEDIPGLSTKLILRGKGIPGEVIEALCHYVSDNHEKLKQKLIAI